MEGRYGTPLETVPDNKRCVLSVSACVCVCTRVRVRVHVCMCFSVVVLTAGEAECSIQEDAFIPRML